MTTWQVKPAPPDTTIQLPPPAANYPHRLNPVTAIPPRISAQNPDDLRAYFDNIFYRLESRAAGHYANQEYDTLTFLEKFTIDNPHAARYGLDRAQNIWNQRYGERVRRLHWTFHKLNDFTMFGTDYFDEHPDAEITIKLSIPVDSSTEKRQQYHQRCRNRMRSQGYHCCEICALSLALQQSSSVRAVDDVLSLGFLPGQRQRHLVVVYGGERIEFMETTETVNGEWTIMELEVAGTLGAVFADTNWDDFTIADFTIEETSSEGEYGD